MPNLKVLHLSKNPCTAITKYRDYVVLMSESLTALDGKDILEPERTYLVNLISRKKLNLTGGQEVYNEIKKKKQELSVEGYNLELRQQKQFLLDNIKNKDGEPNNGNLA